MSGCDPNSSLLDDIQDIVRDVLIDLDDAGVLTYGYQEVYLVYETTIKEGIYGRPPEVIKQTEMMSPSPRVALNTKIYNEEEIITKTGTAKLSQVPASNRNGVNYTREQIEGASYFLLDGNKYDIVDGGLGRDPAGIFWEITLKRRKTGRRTE